MTRNLAEFRAGLAYAAHYLRHAAGTAHHDSGPAAPLRALENRPCCHNAVLGMLHGVADALEAEAQCTVKPHEHAHEPGPAQPTP